MEGQGNCPAGGVVEKALDEVNTNFNNTALFTGLSVASTIVLVEINQCFKKSEAARTTPGTVVGLTPTKG